MLRKIFVFAVVMFLCSFSRAQKSIDGLINAEKSFAAYSVANGTKDAFLKFADSAALVFDQGKFVNAIETWKKRDRGNGTLNWFPKFADISASEDLGYTSGPWTFTVNDSVVARGIYATVWHRNGEGDWKFLIDLGVAKTPTDAFLNMSGIDSTTFWQMDMWGNFDSAVYLGSRHSFQKTEKDFIKKTATAITKNSERKYWYGRAASKIRIGGLLRNGRTPLVQGGVYGDGGDDFYATMHAMPDTIQYKILGSASASSRDIGFFYGTITVKGKKDGYMRIWRREQKSWKIALEVLRY